MAASARNSGYATGPTDGHAHQRRAAARSSALIRPMQLDLAVQLYPEAGLVQSRRLDAAILRDRFAQQLGMEHRHHLVGLGRHYQVLRERAVMAGDDEVIAVDR